ncbi:Hsp20/alpha crystallin family protein [Pontibacter sp. BT310]|uniref:Hsp20/alpha crystallin family protein n=1 Tax=Pontibacter populi TaxID=890055 RepID=A0ABS6X7Q7_9BACT|nr:MULTISPECIES: Hsp20/alpha crystallin family protein [Pontibacter]MBJ6117180.1 Hsp20/alpha crystallin family protein [Pontibacter sp. BT310]MBR0569605.1 Hsp20/alpha crystallin family protein [Microvirga sp. STS03]MBW3364033.1 Hsp20/alpha crystallin family protein [Pontibacter populi]
MALNRYTGMENNMPQSFSSMLDRFFNESVNSKGLSSFTPHVDACETQNGYEIEVALPGIRKEDVSIDFQEGRLTITGERRFEKSEGDGRRYQMLETQYGTFNRTFYLPDNVNPDKIKARMENGILMVTVPKDEHKTMKRQITIASEDDRDEATTIKPKKAKTTENGKAVEA